MPQSRGQGGRDWGLIGDSIGDIIISTRGIIDTEMVVSTCIRAAATSLPYRFGESVGRLPGTVPAGRPTPPGRPVPTHVTPFGIDK